MTLHLEVLNQDQRRILPALGNLASKSGFYLGGGMALAMQFGHRLSVDFDWFRAEPLEDPMSLAQTLREADLAPENLQVAPGTLHGVVGGVRVSFLQYSYPLVGDLVRNEGQPFALASLDDLACMKLAAVAQRGSRRDFVDAYALGLRHKPLSAMLNLYRRKYSTDDVIHVLIGLAYFDDAEEEPMPNMIWDDSWDTIKQCIGNWVREVTVE